MLCHSVSGLTPACDYKYVLLTGHTNVNIPTLVHFREAQISGSCSFFASIHFGLLSATRVCQVLGKEVPQDWSDAQGRANRAISSRDRVVFAPWDIEFGRLSGRYVDVRDYEAPTTLESAIEAQSDEEKLFTLVSAAYQASKIYPSGRIGSRLLAPVADSYFDQYLQSFDAPYEGADTSLLLIILYKSYQSIR